MHGGAATENFDQNIRKCYQPERERGIKRFGSRPVGREALECSIGDFKRFPEPVATALGAEIGRDGRDLIMWMRSSGIILYSPERWPSG